MFDKTRRCICPRERARFGGRGGTKWEGGALGGGSQEPPITHSHPQQNPQFPNAPALESISHNVSIPFTSYGFSSTFFCPINPAIKVESTCLSHYVILSTYEASIYSFLYSSDSLFLLTPTVNLHSFLTLLLQSPQSLGLPKTASVSEQLPSFLNQIHPFLTFPLLALKATWKPSSRCSYRQRLNHAQLQVPFLSLALPAIAQSSAPSPRHALITWGRGAGRTPESEDENPVADGPEEADAIFGSPLPSAASLLSRSSSSRSRIFPTSSQNPRCAGTSCFPSGASSDMLCWPPGPTQGGTIRMAWGTILVSHRFSNFNPFRRSYFPSHNRVSSSGCRENCVWIKPHLKEKGGEWEVPAELPFSLATACLSPNPTASLPVAKGNPDRETGLNLSQRPPRPM